MAKRRFQVEVTVRATLELDDAVLQQVDDAWRRQFYPLVTNEEVAGHVGCALVRGWSFDQLDGFRNLPANAARIVEESLDTEATEELPPKRSHARLRGKNGAAGA